jgi:dTDP-glucose 4,6-dehydratase
MAEPHQLSRVLVTGGAGFIGSHLCRRLLEEGCEVIVLDNLLTGRMENIEPLLGDPKFSFEHYDVTNYLYVEGDLDAILHFASPASPADFERLPIVRVFYWPAPPSATAIPREVHKRRAISAT